MEDVRAQPSFSPRRQRGVSGSNSSAVTDFTLSICCGSEKSLPQLGWLCLHNRAPSRRYSKSAEQYTVVGRLLVGLQSPGHPLGGRKTGQSRDCFPICETMLMTWLIPGLQ